MWYQIGGLIMNNNKFSSLNILKVLGCFIFDIAILIAFFKGFGLFLIIAPAKSIIIFLVLCFSILALNTVIIFQDILFRYIGLPYSNSIITCVVLYAIISNSLSFFFLLGSTIWYLVWELIIFAIFLIILSAITTFTKGVQTDKVKNEKEQADKTSILLQLIEIENALAAKEKLEGVLKFIALFEDLKERIQASTPFGRISNNNQISDIELKIKNNLSTIKSYAEEDISDKNKIEIQKLISDTKRLVIDREQLNII